VCWATKALALSKKINGKTDRALDALAPGGIIPIEWRDDGEVVLAGCAEVVYSGEWLINRWN
jgi:diaminopimelate epimerase